MRYLKTTDPLEAEVMAAVASRRLRLREDIAESDAVKIANAVGRML